jgi:hypothetical protein
MEKGDKPHK